MASPLYADHFVRLNGVRHHYQEWGDRAAPAVLLLHGLTQQSHTFDGLAARLAVAYRCLALDFRGRGESDWAPPATYTVPQYVADVQALLHALGLARAHLFGTSLGGLVSLSLAAVAPGTLLSLGLNDIGPAVDPRGGARIAAYTASLPTRFTDLAEAVDWARRQYPWLGHLASDEMAEALRWALLENPDGSWRLRCDPAIAGQRPRPATLAVAQDAWWAAFAALTCPILLIRGAESDILSRQTAEEMARRQPGLLWVDVPGVGHAPTLGEAPVLAAVDRFYGLAR